MVLPESVRPLFLAAGWFPGRRAWFTRTAGLRRLASYSRGAALVREFGGLHVGLSGPGRERPASDVQFYRWPTAACRDAVADQESPGADLFPLGLAHRGHMEFFVDAQGRLLVDSIPDGRLLTAGETFEDGIECLLLGRSWPETR
ncbi:SUKH-3 domain-containing protein [Lignipirellula cremea]|uniref:SUKH-3 immunity protein of toxin-antitoxin system n=1 Tax=Lignipirellula cremea TaxID=2528010 RepID=A0A518DY70_9BACT|nr:SUKH-3 domain-containing protein [Lignipirellula cremea]QDU96751.1 hypothetical protein Pla8534_45720 [Lignipirellula cremea]